MLQLGPTPNWARPGPAGVGPGAAHLSELFEQAVLEQRLVGLLLAAQSQELPAAVRLDAQALEHVVTDAAEDEAQRPGQDSSFRVGTFSSTNSSTVSSECSLQAAGLHTAGCSTEEREGLPRVGDSIGENQRVFSFQDIFDQIFDGAFKQLTLCRFWAVNLKETEPLNQSSISNNTLNLRNIQ